MHRRLEYTRWAYAVLIAAVLFAYRGSLDLGFVHDDHKTIVANPLIRDLSALPAYVSPDYYRLSGDPLHWRPVATLSHLAVHQVAGLDPRAHHAASILLHAANACALYTLLRRVTGPGALVGALWFALHPALSEAVICPTFRRDALVLAALLVALWCAFKAARGSSLWLVPLALVQLAGAGAKETATVFVLLVPLLLTHLAVPIGIGPELARRTARGVLFTCLGGTLAYLAARFWLQAHSAVTVDAAHVPALPERIALALAHLATYLQLLVFPWPLSPERASVAAGAVPLVAALAILAALARHPPRGLARAALAWIVLPLVPVLAFVPTATAERYLYVSTAGAALAVALALDAAAARLPDPRWALIAFLPVLALETRCLQDQVSAWRDPLVLWSRAAAHFPESFRIHIGLADGHLRHRDLAAAERHLRRALELYPESDGALRGLAQVLARAGKPEDAARAYATLLARKPVDGPAIERERDSLLRPAPPGLR